MDLSDARDQITKPELANIIHYVESVSRALGPIR